MRRPYTERVAPDTYVAFHGPTTINCPIPRLVDFDTVRGMD